MARFTNLLTEMKYLVGKPKIYNEDSFKAKLDDILARDWYSNNGKYVQALENGFAQYSNAGCVAVNNATAALEAVIAVHKSRYGIPDGAFVAVPSYTFVATVSAIYRNKLVPIYIDIGDDYQMDLEDLEENLVKYHIPIVLPVNLFGGMVDYWKLKKLKARFGFFIISDSAHGLGIQELGAQEGVNIFSGHPTKSLGGFEAGLITSNNHLILEELREMRNFYFDSQRPTMSEPEIYDLGTNIKLNEVSAAALLTQLEEMTAITDHFWTNFCLYAEYLPKEVKLFGDLDITSNFGYIIIESQRSYQIQTYLKDYGIESRKYFKPVHLYDYYSKRRSCAGKLEKTMEKYRLALALPTGLHVGEEDIKFICSKISECLLHKD